MREPTDDDRWEVAQRLEALGFPFNHDGFIEEWVNAAVMSGVIERTAISEGIMSGQTVGAVARSCGISELRALHHLSRKPGQGTSEHDPWRLVTEQEGLDE